MSTEDAAAPPSGLSASEADVINDAFVRSPLLSVLDAHEIQRLLADSQPLVLAPGEHLFRQGDASDCVYIVTSGILSAILEGTTGKSQVVGSVRAGESVGEMGVLTNAPRSLSIAARTASTLLRIDARGFEAVCLNHPTLLLKVVHVISERNRETIRALSPFGRRHTTTIVPLHDGGIVDGFLRSLREGVRATGQFGDPDTPGDLPPEDGQPAVATRPRVLAVDAARSPEADRCLESADRVLLVADARRYDGAATETGRRVLDPAGLSPQIERELVLLREDGALTATARWLQRAAFARHHHVRLGRDADLRRLLRHLCGQSVSLVLSGGGIRGWVHLGAIRALEDRNVPIDGVGGSSIGAVVGACLLEHGTAAGATRSFGRIAAAIGRSKGVGSLTYPAVSILNGRRWTHALMEEFGEREIEDLPVPFFAVSCNLSRNDQVVHRGGRVWEAVRASSSLPALVPPFVRDGQLFVDGGIVNNIPVDVARAVMGGGCRTIAIELSGAGELDAREYRFPPVLSFLDALLAKLRLRHRDFRFISIGEVVFRSLTHGSMAKTTDNLRGADIVLRPAFPNTSFLSTADHEALIELGYRSMLAQLDARPDFHSEL